MNSTQIHGTGSAAAKGMLARQLARDAAQGVEARVTQHIPLVRKVAWHLHGRIGGRQELEDLIQIGLIALVEAAQTFEERGAAFASYAAVRVRGAMLDHLRRQARICRNGLQRRKALARARDTLEQRLLRAPTDAEMADELSLTPAAYQAYLASAEIVHQDSLDDHYDDQNILFATADDDAEQALLKQADHAALVAALRELPEREALVLQLYYVEERNLDEIGAVLDIGAARVCQIKKAALTRMRGLLLRDE